MVLFLTALTFHKEFYDYPPLFFHKAYIEFVGIVVSGNYRRPSPIGSEVAEYVFCLAVALLVVGSWSGLQILGFKLFGQKNSTKEVAEPNGGSSRGG